MRRLFSSVIAIAVFAGCGQSATERRLADLEFRESMRNAVPTEAGVRAEARFRGGVFPLAEVAPQSVDAPRVNLAAVAAQSTLSTLAWLMGPPILAGGFGGGGGAPGSAGLPAGCTDDTIARADGAAGATQCSAAIVEDDGDLVLAAGDALRFADDNVGLIESGTDDLDIRADNEVAGTWSGSGLSIANGNGLTFVASAAEITATDGTLNLGATTFSGDATFNGGTGALGFGTGETLVPADGTLNVTGALLVSSSINTTNGVYQSVAGTTTGIHGGGGPASAQASIYLRNAAEIEIKPADTFGVDIETSGTKVACDSTQRGSIFYEAGGAGVADVFYVCTKSAADAYAWRDIALVTP